MKPTKLDTAKAREADAAAAYRYYARIDGRLTREERADKARAWERYRQAMLDVQRLERAAP